MTALATALLRAWSARDRLPRLTRRGKPAASRRPSLPGKTTVWWIETLLELNDLAKRTAPSLLIIAQNFPLSFFPAFSQTSHVAHQVGLRRAVI